MEKTNSYANEAFKIIGGIAALATLVSFAFVPALPFAFATFALCMVLYQLTLPRGYETDISPEKCLSRRIDTSTLINLSRRYRNPGEEASWTQIVDFYRSVRSPEAFWERIDLELSCSWDADQDRKEIAQGLIEAKAPQTFLRFLEPKV